MKPWAFYERPSRTLCVPQLQRHTQQPDRSETAPRPRTRLSDFAQPCGSLVPPPRRWAAQPGPVDSLRHLFPRRKCDQLQILTSALGLPVSRTPPVSDQPCSGLPQTVIRASDVSLSSWSALVRKYARRAPSTSCGVNCTCFSDPNPPPNLQYTVCAGEPRHAPGHGSRYLGTAALH